jgi:hypothetical protein
MGIRLVSGTIVEDHHKLDRLSWADLSEFAYKRCGIVKKDFANLVRTHIENEKKLWVCNDGT